MNMSILERVRVLRSMGAHRNRALFYEMKRKGVINKEVGKLLRSM
jgi:glutaminase